jgi:phosphotransferase system  glucose/maltose/N-acetylglucosamine-specific IIC component
VTESGLQVTYSLDGQENVTVTGNTTLTHLTEGEHNVVVYALDDAGNVGTLKTIFFTVKLFPTTLLIIAAAAIAATGGASLAYIAKTRKTRRKAELFRS